MLTSPPDSASSTHPMPAADAPWQSWLAYAMAWSQADWSDRASSPAAAGSSTREWPVTWYAYHEATPGPRWQALWHATATAYRDWYLSEGEQARPSLPECEAALRRHMPELVETWKTLVRLADGDEVAARLLTMWRTPVFAAGCTQVTMPGTDPALLRTYDYDPALSEAVIATTDYSGARRVLGTSDLLWGLVDGMNDDGLGVSITYGGRPGGGVGFAIPLVVRYVLETAATVAEAIAVLRRLPVAQAYNVALVDTTGAQATVFVAPGEEPRVSDLRVSANHRLDEVEHPEIASPLGSVERQGLVTARLAQAGGGDDDLASLQELFGEAPIRTDHYSAGFGTLYTVTYHPARGVARWVWGDSDLTRSFADADTDLHVVLRGR